MSGVLLDTHTFLWSSLSPQLLSNRARDVVSDLNTDVYFSIVSVWEVGIKAASGKLTLIDPLNDLVHRVIVGSGFHLLPIDVNHVSQMMLLPFHHRDPFDRLLVAQSLAENLLLVSTDGLLDAYGIQRIW